MLSKLKSKGESDEDLAAPLKEKLVRGSGYSATWKFWILSHYEYAYNSVTVANDIIAHSQEDKENRGQSEELSRYSLGSIVSDLWGGEVKRIRRGPRGNRQIAYANLQRIHDERNRQALPNGWQFEGDEDYQWTYFRRTQVDFNGQRSTLDLKVELPKEQSCYPKFTLTSHGCETDLGKTLQLPVQAYQSPSSILNMVGNLVRYVDHSTLCPGFTLANGEDLSTQLPHIVGTWSDHTDHEKSIETRAFSSSCLILSNTGGPCRNCGRLKTVHGQRKARRESREFVHPSTNKRFLSRDEILDELKQEQKRRRNAESREQYWKDKFTSEAIEFEDDDQEDLVCMFNSCDQKEVPEDMQCLWEQQSKVLQTTSRNGYRWHPKIIRLCIDLYCKNPHVLDPLRKFIRLPSNKTIRMYKNRVQQEVGWCDTILEWCLTEAKARNFKEEDYWGGFVIDEMKIQENLEMVQKNGKHKLVGFVELGDAHDNMEKLMGKEEPAIATHVLQFIFLSDCGFRFPIAQFPSANCSATDLYFQFWKGVQKMNETGFTIYWCILDGADCNRQFFQLHFKDTDPASKNFVTKNAYTGEPMVFIMDCKHNFKKIRNNIEKSNTSKKPRCLTLNGKPITWKIWNDAYNWDQSSFSLPLHERLTPQHLELDPAARMRNHLAEDVLDSKMLFMMKCYQDDICSNSTEDQSEGTPVDSAIKLLQHTSQIIDLFSSKCPITNTSDSRLRRLKHFHSFLLAWKDECGSDNSKFISSKLWFDIQSMCLGFNEMVRIKLERFPQSVIKPAIINQDCAENHFCQVRSCNGQNNNPTYRQQESTQNSIRFGQTLISRKSNAGISSNDSTACSLYNPSKSS